MRLFTVTLLAALFVISACSAKEESPEPSNNTGTNNTGNTNNPSTPPKKTRAEQLKGHTWKIIAASTNPPVNGSSDYYAAFMRACDRDNIYTFDLAAGKLVIDENTDVCPSTDQKRYLDLSLDSPNTPQSFTVGSGDANVGNYTHQITSWQDDTQFQTHVTGSFSGFTFTIDYTFKAQ